MKVFISVCLCGPHAYTQIEHCPLAFLYFTSRLFTPQCPHTEMCDQNVVWFNESTRPMDDAPMWEVCLLHNNGVNVHLK